jgi:putative acetyltransferase
VGLRGLGIEGVCEMKRLYVAPEGRGSGLGKALVNQISAEAKAIGYTSMRLDTLETMVEAKRLYTALGFVEREAYYYTPTRGTVFFELELTE